MFWYSVLSYTLNELLNSRFNARASYFGTIPHHIYDTYRVYDVYVYIRVSYEFRIYTKDFNITKRTFYVSTYLS